MKCRGPHARNVRTGALLRADRLLLLLLLLQEVLLMAEKLALFICVENAGRSLMAEAMFNASPPPGWRATSAGTKPAAAANPRTRAMLEELGLPPPEHAPQLLSTELMDRARVRVTMGCLDDASCPAHLKSLELRDWMLEDPAKLDDPGFRRVRDQVASLVKGLRTELVLSDRKAASLVETAHH
ncbi:MAG TPA: low molecular weight phosphatase family protein [Thermoplasmata archaeon]|nr:low molecular weight phosphatase family protein [Thermoplasmata archaeon]